MEVGDGVVETWTELWKLSGRQILASAERATGNEREALVSFLLHLAVIEQRGDYEKVGQRSLWNYLTQTLHFPKCQTSLRYHSARLLLKFPEVAHDLADGRLNMTTLVLLKDILDRENLLRLLDAASKKTKEEVLVLVASFNAPILPVGEFAPVPPAAVVELSRGVVALREDGGIAPATATSAVPEADGTVVTPPVSGKQAVLVMGAPVVQKIKPLAPDQLLLTATVTNAFKNDLEELAEALSHTFPERNLGDLLHYCVKQVLVRVGKRRGAVPVRGSDRKRAGDPPVEKAAEANPAKPVDPVGKATGVRRPQWARVHIPAPMERAVWQRDGSCRWQLENGKPCGSTHQCQLDHIKPVALGGLTVLSNLRLLCRQHNLEAEREAFGDALVDQFTSDARAGPR